MIRSKIQIYILVSFLLIGLGTSCSLTKGLDDKDMLYMGAEIKIKDKSNAQSVDNFSEIKSTAPTLSTKPGLGNIYIGIYNIFNKTEDTGFKHWVKYKLGNKPIVFEYQYVQNTEAKLKYYLNGKGFFSHEVSCDTSSSGRKIYLTCDVELNERYKIDSIIFPVDSTYLSLKLDKKQKSAILKEGAYYDRERLDYERMRITQLAGDMGYAEFGNENVFYYVDTAKGNYTLDLYSKIITPTDSTNHNRYILDSINIFTNYTLNDTLKSNLYKKAISPSITIYEYDHYLNYRLIEHVLLEKTDTFYHRSNEKKTINRLQDLGLFRYINIENRPNPNGDKGHIIQNIYLTPEKMQNISTEFELNNRSGNFLGMGASIRYNHKNIFRHAEQFNASMSGQIETQIGDGATIINSSDLTGSMEVLFPRVIVPFINIKEGKTYIPKTSLKANYTYQRRSQYYTLNSATGKFGYIWRQTSRKFHEFYPLVINQVSVGNKTIEFQELLDQDLRLKRSFENTLIAGLQYNYTYSDQLNSSDRSHFYFKNELESSGNLINVIKGGNTINPEKIAGINYAQFIKNTIDIRKYFPLKNSDIAARLLVGSAFSYGNSSELPYIKQYVIGGSNSVRAFRLRGLGPGSYVADSTGTDSFTSQFVDQTGDLKLEMNVEYRFPIFRFLKGAVFADAGNVWLINNTERPEGNFKFNSFYKELGVGTGLGIRLDFNFFLIRMDIAFPLRAPFKTTGFDWIVSDINPLSKSWRSENLRYNLGIGYPF